MEPVHNRRSRSETAFNITSNPPRVCSTETVQMPAKEVGDRNENVYYSANCCMYINSYINMSSKSGLLFKSSHYVWFDFKLKFLVDIFKCQSTSDTTIWLQLCCQSESVLDKDLASTSKFTQRTQRLKTKQMYTQSLCQRFAATMHFQMKCWC